MLTVEEAAARKGLSVAAIYKAVREGRLSSRRVLGRVGVETASLDMWQPERGGKRQGAGRKKTAEGGLG